MELLRALLISGAILAFMLFVAFKFLLEDMVGILFRNPKKEKVVHIEDLKVYVEASHFSDGEGYLILTSVEDPNKTSYGHEKWYEQYKDSKEVVAQEVFYNYKDEFYSIIKFASEEDYNKLREYKTANFENLMSVEEIKILCND